MNFGVNILPQENGNNTLGSVAQPWTIVSPNLTGIPTAPTALPGTNNTQIATTAFVMNAMQGSIVITITPATQGITATATLKNGSYSNSAISNAVGQIVIPLSQFGTYTLIYDDPRVKSDRTVTVASNVAVYIAAKYSELITYTVRIQEPIFGEDTSSSTGNTVYTDQGNSSTNGWTYLDDAVNMTKGSSDWDTKPIFNDIQPCVFENGSVKYYLQPNDWTKKLDGTASVLTGADGDVMIEFRRFGYKIWRETENAKSYLYVSVTNYENQAGYCYDAFSRESEGDLDKFYKGAYKGYIDGSGKLRSIAGVQPTANKTIGAFRSAAQLNGDSNSDTDHYQQSTYAQLKALQCLYLIKYGDSNSQAKVGNGIQAQTSGSTNLSYVCGYNATADNGTITGTVGDATSTAKVGMTYGSTANNTTHVRLFGIEDFWGNIWEWVDGLTTDSDRNIITSWNSFSNEDTTVTTSSLASGFKANASGYVKRVAGTSEAGFMPVGFGGSTSTYLADSGALYASCVLFFGGSWSTGAGYPGAFYLDASRSASAASRSFGARLSYV